MLDRLRRIVTGHDTDGQSVILIDGPPGNSVGTPESGLAEVWKTGSGVLDSRSLDDAVAGAVLLEPPTGGTMFRYFAIAPHDPAETTEQMEAKAEAGFAAMGASHARVDTRRHPRMHKTRTIDYIILLKGRVTMLVDDGVVDLEPFDVVVQQGTNHAWINRSDEPALLCAILVDADIA